MPAGSFYSMGRVSRATLAVNPAVWLLYGSMFAIFAVGSMVMAFVVPGLRLETCLPASAVLALVSASAFGTTPPAMDSIRNHAAIASVYVCTTLAMVAFQPHSLIPLSAVMFLGPFAASRLKSHKLITAHCLAGSIALGLPAVLGLIGPSATFGVAVLVPALWLLTVCVVIVLDAAEAQGTELEQLVRRDPLTGIGNRRLLDEQLTLEIERHQRTGEPLSVLALDLNGFKALNDVVGHSAGDAVLQKVAAALRGSARARDTVVRQGGDEFCMLLVDCTPGHARFVETEIRTRLAGLADGAMPISTGVGIATYPADASDAHGLLGVADARLAADKARNDHRLDPRHVAVALLAPSGDPLPGGTTPPSPIASTGLVVQVSRRVLARDPYLWFATGLVFAAFGALAAGCTLLMPGAASWSAIIPLAAAIAAALILVTRDGPAMDSLINHGLLAAIYLGSAASMAAYPLAAGAGMGVAIFIGPQTAIRLIDRRQIVAHYVAATLAFAGLVVFGLVNLTTSLSLMIMLLAMWGLGLACMFVLEVAERQGEQLEHLVRRDPLTAVGNRRMLTEQLSYELARHSRIRRPLTVVALDLNGFKPLNDQFGHAAGDQLLRDVARAIERVVGDDDTVVRQGGDEFCVLLPDTSGAAAIPTANAIRAELAAIDAHGLTITTGVGIASYPTEATTAQGLLDIADELLRASKETALARVRRADAATEHLRRAS